MHGEQGVEELVCLAASLHCDLTAPKLTQGGVLEGSESYLTVSMIALLLLCVSAFEQRALRA